MHTESMTEMQKVLKECASDLFNKDLRCGDYGSMDVNGTYKELLPPTWKYTGIDIQAGKNVDVVMRDEYTAPIACNHFDVIISGNCLEHVRNPFWLVREMARTLKPGGMMFLTVPCKIHEHRYPIHTFHILPDGMRSIIESAHLDVVKVYKIPTGLGEDCWGIARKPE